ncbi:MULTISPECIES: hypothetical protein [Curtobacterium]|uniref:Uncharacterized protein n=1 Tax=Curtobacterium citreum TaxID=2036 RepID=A0A850E006_9MICO|nr:MULTISPECIES: hypothetical protein [Curtobacterium]NUU29955.1 hypothetical protein [Curtobacterium albidum]QKS17403.1 hypothetical protein HUN59_15375 [Curtobacterium sp. Csp2]WIJ46040.1 hypothetical protein QPK07_03500 [Curtobacterium citreum]
MNPYLLWTAVGSGLVLLATALVSRRSGARRPDVPRSALDAAVGIVGAFLVCIAAALFAGPATRVLVVWLVVLLTVGLVCTVLRVRPGMAAAAGDGVPQRAEALPAALRMLDRADYHQVSVVRLAVTVGEAAQLGTAFGSETVDAARAALARALRGVVPPDAPLWTEQHDRVVALVRQEECDLTAWRAEVETALVAVSPDRVPTVPTATWRTTSTDDLGYRLDDLERED